MDTWDFPILNYEPGNVLFASGAVPLTGSLYYWPTIENLTGGVPETDLEAQQISALPNKSLIIVITITEGETHWLRVLSSSTVVPVTDLEAGIIVPRDFDILERPYILMQQFAGTVVVPPPIPPVTGSARITSTGNTRVTTTGDIRIIT